MSRSGRAFWGIDGARQERRNLVQQFGNSIIPSHRRRQPVYSDARYYEIDYTRQLLERAQLARSERELRQQQGERARREDVDSGASTVAVTPTPSEVPSFSDTARTLVASEDSSSGPAPHSSGSGTGSGSMDVLDFHDDEQRRVENFVDEDEDMGESEGEVPFGDSDEALEEDDLGGDDDPAPPFNPISMGLKEIGGLAHFRVSSFKPGNGVEELVNDDTDRYWQSDGVQPHRLTMTFVKCVEIRALRFHVDYHQDESYTPTKINWYAGTSEHDLLHFATSTLVNPAGWTDVPITGAGGGEDGNSLMAWVLQMQIVENHQNGKDTHIRGVKIYGFDDQLRAAGPTGVRDDMPALRAEFKVDESKSAEENEELFKQHVRGIEFAREFEVGDPSGTASSLDFMEDPQLR